MKTSLIIHGHFYQPPRENPWTGQVELQASATPYHDWNERVAAECYTPNTRSRILDNNGRILEVVNNFKKISFNMGPTLLWWMEEHLPETYERIIKADSDSVNTLGFGNAMAQVYNHMILPLATKRDRQTQIKWGMEDFYARFRRKASGIWLAETAVNDAVMEDLASQGIEFTILAPTQAELIRADGEEAWRDVSSGDIPTGRPYYWSGKNGKVAIFFYHEEASRAIAFEHLLRNASTFADRIQRAAQDNSKEVAEHDPLVLIATDGESYGHHEPMGDMCLAYLTTREAQARDIEVTNPTAFLSQHPPSWQVKLKAGKDGLGTAWSCAHGVGRWKEDCGCSTGGPPSWNQAWRAPLREAFDLLRHRIDPLFEQEAGKLLHDPWAARDEFIHVILGRTIGAAKNFLDTHAKKRLKDDERERVYKLMEMQLHGMLMYTSCGWFFSDISGIETVQNLAYFVRSSQLAQDIAGHPVTSESMETLAKAKSNIEFMGTGVDILTRFVRPSILSPEKVAVHKAINALLENRDVQDRLYSFRITTHRQNRLERQGWKIFSGRSTVKAERTGEGGTFDLAVIAGTGLKLRAYVKPYDQDGPTPSTEDVLGLLSTDGFDATDHKLSDDFLWSLGLPDMLQELRLQAMGILAKPVVKDLDRTFDELFMRHKDLLESLQSLGVGMPEALKAPVAYAASRRINKLVARGISKGDLDTAAGLAKMCHDLGLQPSIQKASKILDNALSKMLDSILTEPDPAQMAEFLSLLQAGRKMGLVPQEAPLQDRVAELLQTMLDELLDPARTGGPWPGAAKSWLQLAGYLNLNIDTQLSILKNFTEASSL